MSRIKRLNSFKVRNNRFLEDMTEIQVVFNKEGWYFDRLLKTSWYEIKTNDGIRAVKSDIDSFACSLENISHTPLSTMEFDALKIVTRISNNKEIGRLYYMENLFRSRRNIKREFMLSKREFIKKIRKLEKENGI